MGGGHGYANALEYLLVREKGKCQLCGKGYGGSGNRWQIHHIVPKSRGGTDRSENLALLHEACHKRIHKNPKLSEKLKKPKFYREAAYLNSFRMQLMERLKSVFGSRIPVHLRIYHEPAAQKIGVAQNSRQRCCSDTGFDDPRDISVLTVIRQVRKKKRSLHEANPRKGRTRPNTGAKRNPKNTKRVAAKDGRLWCLWDKVRIGGQVGFISGFTSGGYAYVQDIEGRYIRLAGKSYRQVPLRQAVLIKRNNNWVERVVPA